MRTGDYVRTKLGPNCNEVTIRKIIEEDENYYILDDFVDFGYGDSTNHIGKEDIIKSSPNIIDLIEVGDYVNGEKVIRLFNPMFLSMGELPYVITDKNNYEPQEIKSIVTKESMESVTYYVK